MNIYVSNLGFHVGDEELKNLFDTYGIVTSAKIITDKETNKSRGFGFVEMKEETEGKTAIKELNGTVIEGRSLNVTIARPREEKKTFRDFWK